MQQGLRFRRLLLAGSCLFLLVVSTGAARPDRGSGEDLPVTVTSDRMEGDFTAGVFTFLDRVKVVRGEMVLHAEEVEVHPANGGEEIERIIARGNVRIMEGTRSSVSDLVEYLREGDLLILTGNARVSDGSNTLSGPVIRIYLEEDRAEVEGSPGERPRFLFHPKDLSGRKGPEAQ